VSKTRVVLAIVLGICAFIVASFSDDALGAARSPSPPLTWLIVGAYLAICQLLVAPKGVGLRANRATLIGMWAPVALIGIGSLADRGGSILSQFVPIELAALLGPVVGAIAAWALPKKATQP
jgi:hypothetical protein